MSRSDEFYGANDVSRMFPGEAPMAAVPWPQARKTPTHRSHSLPAIHEAMANPDAHREMVDPRNLRATQGMLTRAGVQHYASGSGELFADHASDINAEPHVFHNDKTGEQVLMSGHHRAAAHLLAGRQFEAVVAHGLPQTHKEAAAYQRDQIERGRAMRAQQA